jgi:hypothetical protein
MSLLIAETRVKNGAATPAPLPYAAGICFWARTDYAQTKSARAARIVSGLATIRPVLGNV